MLPYVVIPCDEDLWKLNQTGNAAAVVQKTLLAVRDAAGVDRESCRQTPISGTLMPAIVLPPTLPYDGWENIRLRQTTTMACLRIFDLTPGSVRLWRKATSFLLLNVLSRAKRKARVSR